jgi:1,4-dihydroxy-2-naphthoate octaprenyltransferase
LPSAEKSGGNAADSGYESEQSNSIFEPVLLLIAGFAAFCARFWRMWFTARTGGICVWISGAALFLLGWIICVFAGIWGLIGHAPLSFAKSPIHTENVAVFCGPFGVSATCYSRAEHVGRFPLIVAELKFRHVERQIFGADFVERAHHASLQDRPEA